MGQGGQGSGNQAGLTSGTVAASSSRTSASCSRRRVRSSRRAAFVGDSAIPAQLKNLSACSAQVSGHCATLGGLSPTNVLIPYLV